jgi:hypothetical protein
VSNKHTKKNQDISKMSCNAHVPESQTQQGAQKISASITYEDAKTVIHKKMIIFVAG